MTPMTRTKHRPVCTGTGREWGEGNYVIVLYIKEDFIFLYSSTKFNPRVSAK